MKMRVAELVRETVEVSVFAFRHPRRATLPEWAPDTHVDVKLPGGCIRQYSLCGQPMIFRPIGLPSNAKRLVAAART